MKKTQEIEIYIKEEILSNKNITKEKIAEAITLLETTKENKSLFNNNYQILLIKSFKQNIISLKELMNIIDNLINNNEELATNLLNYITNNYNLDKYQTEINYLKNKINEKQLYNKLSINKRELYNFYLIEGSKAFKNNNLNLALDLYEQGKKITNHPIFNYYIGKIYFKFKNFDKSYEYISKYEENGGEKELHSLLYLWGNDKYLDKTKISKIDEKAKKLFNFYDNLKNWDLPNFKKKLITPKNDINPDYAKYKGYRKITLSEQDFETKNINIENFNNYHFKDKLIAIRQLYNNGQITLASTLIKELQKSNLDSQSRKQVANIKKLMKLK